MMPLLRPTRTLLTATRSECVRLLLLVVAFALGTADVVAEGLLTYLDQAVRGSVAPGGQPAGWARLVSSLGNLGVAGAVALIVALVAAHLTWRLWPLLLLVGANAAVAVVVLPLKALVPRAGPGATALPPGLTGVYPSGHTATAGVCFGVAALILAHVPAAPRRVPPERVGLAVGLLAGAVTGVGLVAGDFHWLSDVLASLLLTAAVMTVAGILARRFAGRETKPDLPL